MTPSLGRTERFAGHQYPQIIPEPEEIRPGSPPPWSHLPPSARSNLSLDLVRSRLRDAHRLLTETSPPEQPRDLRLVADALPAPVTVKSAVLAALFEEDGETQIVLTRRSFNMRVHRGEIALPGGRSHDGETSVDTALREAHEEVGLEPEAVAPIAWLTPIASFGAGSSIWPIVGLLERRPELTIDPIEVDRAFTVALSDLVAEGAFVEERWRRPILRPGADDEGYYPLHFFRVPGDLVWGATARVLTELLSIVTGVD
jgi:8-oxo-dGTP pyrophosphatase MutT (NUDIX family)